MNNKPKQNRDDAPTSAPMKDLKRPNMTEKRVQRRRELQALVDKHGSIGRAAHAIGAPRHSEPEAVEEKWGHNLLPTTAC